MKRDRLCWHLPEIQYRHLYRPLGLQWSFLREKLDGSLEEFTAFHVNASEGGRGLPPGHPDLLNLLPEMIRAREAKEMGYDLREEPGA